MHSKHERLHKHTTQMTHDINDILQEFKAEISLLKSKAAALTEEVKYKTTQVFNNIFA